MSALRLRDFALLGVCCAVLSAFPLIFNRSLSTHETTHCQNVREMRGDGDWVIPHYGGRPWLERPPLPFWLTQPVLAVFGDHAASYRLTSALVGLACVLLVGWVASLWYGRSIGLLSGVALATLRQFSHYAAGPEAEIFLCGMVTATTALFVYLEFRLRDPGSPTRQRGTEEPLPGASGFRPVRHESWLVGRRPWALLAFFVMLGLTNLVKGLFFGDAFVLLPAAVYLLWGERPLAFVRRYVWLPGWLAFAVCGSAWAVAAYVRYPDVVELWFSDYGGRFNQGFMREPVYYYLLHLPWLLFPWSLLALGGLVITWRQALTQGRTPERFLWCWALVPLGFLSIPQGKHQHYLLPAIAPWAILGALGTVRLWAYLCEKRKWFSPSPKRAWLSAGASFVLLAWICWTLHAQPRLGHDRYAADRTFARSVTAHVGEDDTLLVLDDWGPLDASWSLFYLDGQAKLLHNASFLLDERVGGPEVYVVARRMREPALREFGPCELLFQSECSRGEEGGPGRVRPDVRLGLYRVRVEAPRHAGSTYVSPMQATGRAPGPWLRPGHERSYSSSPPAPAGGRGDSGR